LKDVRINQDGGPGGEDGHQNAGVTRAYPTERERGGEKIATGGKTSLTNLRNFPGRGRKKPFLSDIFVQT